MKVITVDNGLVIKSWCESPEEGAIEQARHLAGLPFAFKHVALMPDTHQGYGMPIGGVLATKGVVIPNAVGVDIGCGMCAVMTSLHIDDFSVDDLKKVMGEIRKAIPVGFNKHDKAQPSNLDAVDCSDLIVAEWNEAQKSLGTLGGGNHFIEIQKDAFGNVWIMLHSGSRNLGKKVADYYNRQAVTLNDRWHSSVPHEWQLAFLPLDEELGQLYMRDMNFCVEYALANRELMLDRIKDIFITCLDGFDGCLAFGNTINIAHNYAKLEHHFGQNVVVHRKGATAAAYGQVGIIPGSQGTSSYIVQGLGNEDSFKSCSHGAGRKMGRKEATRSLNLQDEIKKLDAKGIVHGIRNVGDLDEASGAYKDIDTVMAEQADLVDIVYRLETMGVIKG